MSSISSFIHGIPTLSKASKEALEATVEAADFGAQLDQECERHHLQALRVTLPRLGFTDVENALISMAIDAAAAGMLHSTHQLA